ncbi:MAG TPA: triose-phosphate isomerase, partial [Opitutae bacterium]|nr:triose-phosphate isomerase [Opitutae bacterium]
MSRKYLIAGNWKMNKTASEAADLIREIHAAVGSQTTVQVCVCPPFTSLAAASELVEQSEIILGAQDMSPHASGAYTGEISAEMLRDLYVGFVILGHSERRKYYGETNQSVN